MANFINEYKRRKEIGKSVCLSVYSVDCPWTRASHKKEKRSFYRTNAKEWQGKGYKYVQTLVFVVIQSFHGLDKDEEERDTFYSRSKSFESVV